VSVREHISGTTRPIFFKIFRMLPYGRGSVRLWQRREALLVYRLVARFMDADSCLHVINHVQPCRYSCSE